MDQEKQKIKNHSDEFRAAAVMPTLEAEKPIAQTAENLIWHSDRGCHRPQMQQHDITQRMSPKDNCRDNVVSASFFHMLKTEQDRSTSSLFIGIPSVKEGFFCIIRAWNSQKHTLEQLQQYGITWSMSSNGTCWDDAISVSLFHTPKTERAHHQRYQTRVGAKQDVFEYIASFGNNYSSPDDYEMQLKPA